MKKLYTLLLIAFTIFGCVLFSACKDNFSSLSMSFYSSTGDGISSTTLTMVEDDDTKASARIGIQLSGIKDNQVGQIKVQSSPIELITADNYIYEGNMVYLDIHASVVGTGKLIVTHMSSNKTKSISLNVQQKSTSLNNFNNDLVISIPDKIDAESQTNAHTINKKDTVQLLPGNSTDKVLYKLSSASVPANVIFLLEGEEVSGSYNDILFDTIEVNSNVTAGSNISIYPVTIMDGFDNTEYKNQIINVVFLRTLTNDTLLMSSPSHEDLSKVIYLIANDTTIREDKYNYNSIQIEFNIKDKDNETNIFDFGNFDYLKYYDISWEKPTSAISISNSDNKFIVQASSNTDKEVTIKFYLEPINAVGDIKTIEKTFKVKGEVKPEDIIVSMQDNEDVKGDLDLYDYYSGSGNALGALFNFEPVVSNSYNDLKTMQIVLDFEILNAYFTYPESGAGVRAGKNIIYNNNLFETQMTNQNVVSNRYSRNNRYVLEFYLFNQPLKFYIYNDGTNQKVISEPITAGQNIFIKYVETSISSENFPLRIDIQTYYNGTLDYLEDIKGVTKTLNFNRLDGVTSFEVATGELNSAGTDITIYKDSTTDEDIEAENLYISKKDEKQYLLFMDRGKVVGIQNKKITNTEFNISVTGVNDTSGLKIRQNINESEESTLITYKYSDAGNHNNAILLILSEDIALGEYIIRISHDSGIEKEIKVLIYHKLETEDITLSLENRDDLYLGKDYSGYDDTCYIVPALSTIQLDVGLVDITAGFVLGYAYEFNFSELGVLNVSNYATINSISSIAKLNFIKGTYTDSNKYIDLTVTVITQKYINIVTPEGEEGISKTIRFFIYEKIEEENISLNNIAITRYMEDFLGYYYKDQSKAEISVLLTNNNLWNYVQKQTQDKTRDIGIISQEHDLEYDVIWYTENTDYIETINQQNNMISLNFRQSQDESEYIRIIYAEVKQFGKTYTLRCVVNVKLPILTQKVSITSELDSYVADSSGYYLNLKAGESYTLTTESRSSFGNITNPDVMVVVTDKYGTANYNVVTISGNIITVKDNISSYREGLRLIVFAKDVLEYSIGYTESGLDDIESYIIDFTNSYTHAGLYKNAYFVIDLILSDGSEYNPYLIRSADDFWEINDNNAAKKAHYVLMSNIDITNTKNYNGNKTISNFTGSIRTYEIGDKAYIYSIYGVKINSEYSYLFKSFDGEIKNINFVVTLSGTGSFAINNENNVGVFSVNSGTIINCSVNFSGAIKLNYTGVNIATVNFGVLVGLNEGIIKYTSTDITGAIGKIELSGNAIVNFGSLVGKNVGQIIGCVLSTDNIDDSESSGGDQSVVFRIYIGDQGAIASVDINAILTNSDSSIGGVAGYNTYASKVDDGGSTITLIGQIYNSYAAGNIESSNGNVGGIIGKNEMESLLHKIAISGTDLTNIVMINLVGTEITVAEENINNYITIRDSYSTMIIKSTGTNTGGIVGYDIGGYYYHCYYQVLSLEKTVIEGNINVGGIAGYSNSGRFEYCYVMSYRWDYNNLNSTFDDASPDIAGATNVGGLIGEAYGYIEQADGKSGSSVIILYSSVNAYISTNIINSKLGGLIGLINHRPDTDYPNAYSLYVYFMGKLEGNVHYENGTDLCFDSNANLMSNYSYSVNIHPEEGIITGQSFAANFVIYGTEVDISYKKYYEYDKDINGGYIYIIYNGAPLVEQAPTSLSATVEKYRIIDGVLHLSYYEFDSDLQINTLSELNKNNTYSIKELLAFSYTPTSLKSVRVSVETSNSNIIRLSDDNFIVAGVGKVTLTFRAVLNRNIYCEIIIYVHRHIGTYVLSESANDISKTIVDTTQNIAMGSSRLYYPVVSGYHTYSGLNYYYETNQNIHLEAAVSLKEGDLSGKTIDYYISISGVTPTIRDNALVFTVDPNTPFSISVHNYLKDAIFNVQIQPYLVINHNGESYKIIDESKLIEFDVKTFLGATDISNSYNAVVLYPNDVTKVSLYLKTDIELTSDEIKAQLLIYENDESLIKNNGEDFYTGKFVKIDFIGTDWVWNSKTMIQTVLVRITILEELNIDSNLDLNIKFEIKNGAHTKVNLTILPQRISSISIYNYIWVDDELQINETLRQDSEGFMIINVAPINAYYDYLEISDIYGREEIIFVQVDKDGRRIHYMDEISSDGKGIKLIPQEDKIFYVTTMTSKEYSSAMHRVKVVAYLDNGEQVSEAYYIDIEVIMRPSVDVTYIEPNGNKITDSDAERDTLYLANGVDAEFEIKLRNTDGSYNIDLSFDDASIVASNYYEIQYLPNDNIYLHYTELAKANSLYGKELILSFTTWATMVNGDVEYDTTKIKFTIVEYVIHSLSVTNSITTNGTSSIYGSYENPVSIQFYFKPTDISYRDSSGAFWNRTYSCIDDEFSTGDSSTVQLIYTILYNLNNTVYSTNYIEILERSTGEKYQDTNIKVETGNGSNGLIITLSEIKDDISTEEIETNIPVKIRVNFNIALYYWFNNANSTDEALKHSWKWVEDADTFANDGSGKIYSPVIKSFDFNLDFSKANTFEDPIAVITAEDFLNMESGDVHYILAQDIELSNYNPIDVNIASFDGNGHTITINSFAKFTETEIRAGLFKQIYENMVIMNLNVSYKEGNFGSVSSGSATFNVNSYYDIASDSAINYTNAYFGGLTAQNNGIITNCTVSGSLAIRASVIEANSIGYKINFFVGGLVAENTSTGYITNSTSLINLYSQSNLGGLVYSNAGKIASSAFEGLIYAYNSLVGNSSNVEVAGFVVNNTGNISMSYVDVGITELGISGNTIGNMSAKDISAGFVYNNSGKIYDCYVDIEKVGYNNNNFSGFVYINGSGTVSNSYTFINQGQRVSSSDNMFGPANTQGIENCYEIMFTGLGYTNRINGLEIISPNLREVQDYYIGFNFGDSISSIWTVQGKELPKLVSTLEKVVYTGAPKGVGNFYDGLRKITKFEEIIKEEDGSETFVTTYSVNHASYGTKANPYLIYNLQTWNNYMSDNTRSYYKLIADIDFSALYGNPITSTYTFMGNIQGNNMVISGLMLYSSNSLNAIGLFKQVISADDISITNAVRNFTISADSILATKTKAVGTFAGIIQDFNVYNINVDSSNLIVVGGNAVGGLAGLIRGAINIEGITSNVGTNSTRVSTGGEYSIYLGRNNNYSVSYNLSNVYYAGSIAGIIDAYDSSYYNIDSDRNVNLAKYFSVKDIKVEGSITAIGDSVGAAFGFIGERVKLENITVNLSGGILAGSQYAGGAVGESRGVIINSSVVQTAESNTIFNNSSYVIAGVVGFNLGGLIIDAYSNVTLVKTGSAISTVAGIVGRNINGVIDDVTFDGKTTGYFVGGIVGAIYDKASLETRGSGSGALGTESMKAVPVEMIKYIYQSNEYSNYINNANVTNNWLNSVFDEITSYYRFMPNAKNFIKSIRYIKVMGLCIGVTNLDMNSDRLIDMISYNNITEKLTFNGESFNSNVGIITSENLVGGGSFTLPYSNIITSMSGLEYTYYTYIVGAQLGKFDAWNKGGYSNLSLVFTNESYDVITIKSEYLPKLNFILTTDNIISPDDEDNISKGEDIFNLYINSYEESIDVTIALKSLMSTFEEGYIAKINENTLTEDNLTLQITTSDPKEVVIKIYNTENVMIKSMTFNIIFN